MSDSRTCEQVPSARKALSPRRRALVQLSDRSPEAHMTIHHAGCLTAPARRNSMPMSNTLRYRMAIALLALVAALVTLSAPVEAGADRPAHLHRGLGCENA